MPNMIGFQSFCTGSVLVWGHRTGKQISLLPAVTVQHHPAGVERVLLPDREQPWALGPGLPVMDMKNMPQNRLSSSRER